MSRLLAVIVASTFAFSSAAGFAADTAKKKEELTKEERAEMRGRADKLIAQRTTQPAVQEKAAVEKAPKAKKRHTQKPAKGTTGEAKPKA
jgi:hypothetical protein